MRLALREVAHQFIDDAGMPCMRVVLARGQGTADIDRETYERFAASGISAHWHLNAPGFGGYGQVKSQHPQRGTLILAREALDLAKGDGLRACFRNGNRRDLRKSNLYSEPNPIAPLLGRRRSRTQSVKATDGSKRAGLIQEEALQVPLGRSGEFAAVDPEDYQRVVADGLAPRWYAVPSGKGQRYVYGKHREREIVGVAREIMGLRRGDGRWLRYLDGDRFNLRRSNLVVDEPGTRKIKTQRHRR